MVADDVTSSFELPRRDRISPSPPAPPSLAQRCRNGLRHPGNWVQLLRFGLVGASGFVVNLAVFAVCVHVVEIDYRLGSVIAYLVSVTSNFWWNRHWTFAHRKMDHPGHQGLKFLIVSLVAYGIQYLILVSLVGAGLDKVAAQALAVTASTPLSFIGQKLWSFRG